MDDRGEALIFPPEYAVVEAGDPLVLGDAKPLLACRACLAVGRPLRPLQRALATVFGDLTGTAVSESDIYPKYLCSYCRALLLKFAAFRDRCLYAQNTCFNFHCVGVPITTDLIKSTFTTGAPYPNLITTCIQKINLEESEDDISAAIIDKQIKNEFQTEQDSDVENFMDATDFAIPSYDGNSGIDEYSSEGADMPDCLVGINSDIYKNDTKKAFKDELASSKGKNMPKSLQEWKGWATTLKRKNNATTNNATKISKQPMPGIEDDAGNNAIDDTDIVVNDEDMYPDSGSVFGDDASHGHDTDTQESLAGTSNDAHPFTLETESHEIKKTVKARKKKSKKQTTGFNIQEIKKWVETLKAKKIKEQNSGVSKSATKDKFLENRRLKLERTCNAKVVQVCKEDQLKHIKARKDSKNYTQAAYKCQMCYRGFGSEFSFNNHTEKHALSHGDYVCDVCNLRYSTKAKLVKHQFETHMYDYICNECGFINKSSKTARDHYKWHKGIKYDCKICGKSFNKSNSVAGHMHLSHGGDMKCSICNETFLGRNGLNGHMKKSHKEAVGAVCPDCGVQFHSGDALRTHRPLDGPCDQTLRACPACGEGFRSEELLAKHKREHRRFSYQCNVCNKEFDVRIKYLTHLRDHQGTSKNEKRKYNVYMCETCGCSATSKAGLESHRMVHTGEKPYQCDHCGKHFRIKQGLQAHIIFQHMGVQQKRDAAECRFCQKTFYGKANRVKHEQAVHQNVRPFKCDTCEKTYQDKCGLQVHINTKHLGQPWPKRIRNRRRPNE